MRLTKKELMSAINHPMCFGSRLVGKKMFAQIINELCEYKTIEAKLGIDLITLFKAKSIWCKTLVEDVQTKERYYENIERVLWGINLEDKEIMVGNPYKFGIHQIKDYGKTWALTKEELL